MIRRLRLLPVALAVWAVAALATLMPATAAPLALGLWASAAVLGALCVRTPRPVVLVGLFACALAATAASHVALAQPDRTADALGEIGAGRAITVQAQVVGKIEPRDGERLAFDARAVMLRVGERESPIAVDVVIQVSRHEVDDPGALDVGAIVRAHGTAFAGYAGDRAVVVVDAARGVEVVAPPTGVPAAASALRRGLQRAVSGLSAPAAGLVPGLAVGDTAAVGVQLDEAMKRTSLSHLTAVSGANCALVVGIAFAAAALAGLRRGLRAAAALAALAGFVVLVTPEPSVVRAAAMASIAMLGVTLGRPAAGTSILCLAVAVLLVTDPWLSTSLGFALSAAATGALLLCARPLAAGLARWMRRPLALAIAVPLSAQLACGPLLVLIAPTVPVYGVLANLLAAPAAPVATIVGLAACLAGPLPVLQSGLAALAWLPAAWVAGVAETFDALPAGQLAWVDGAVGAVLLAAVGAAIGLVIAARRRGGMLQATAAAVLAASLGVGAGTAALGGVAGGWTLPADWTVLACDVGQGDAVLLRSAGATALVDTGPEPDALAQCLARAGIGHLDLLVLTHFDLDHIGGVDAVIGRVSRVLHGPVDDAEAVALIRRLADAGATATTAGVGLSGTLGGARWRAVWPPSDSAVYTGGNDASVVIDVRGGGIPSSLLLGDLSAAPQRALARSGALAPPYAVVKVAHHGSADQDPGLYDLAAPSVALVTVGVDNDYGHPRDETLDVLEALGATVARTDIEGVVAVWTADDELRVWRERVGAAG
ncbi:ComEC/Rec2 family competence protein [Microbacterium terricola]|uniref:Competence protein ComEC n=1 Tax=Microbacterium terricola TaxID=344163 RepID=A0ABM8DYR1_9MICO|nr:ComEC/Rec2 family competence protein [Microbacterium terricola]UYK41485.1 ComEC/Rec2 family competence protein [Microbacterium terricola]BDV30725.1 competence protein ComEC [Microbacterium terricola]